MNLDLELNQAESYEAYLVPAMFVPFTEVLVARAEPRSDDRILDVGCGTGIVSRMVSPMVGSSGRVVGLDIDKEMLAVARSLVPADVGQVEWREGDVVEMPFEDAEFDLVFCQAALQFFPDRIAALLEIHRVLAPSGRVVVSVFRSIERNPAYEVLARALERHVSPEAGAMRRAIFSLGDADELVSLLVDAGFEMNSLSSVQKTIRFPSPEEFLRRQLASQSPWIVDQLDHETQEALINEMNAALRNSVDEKGLAMTMEIHLLVAAG